MGGVNKKMGFKGNRGPLIITAVLCLTLLIAAVALASNSPAPPKQEEDPMDNPDVPMTFSFTVSGDIGIDVIKITNLNTPATMRLTTADLPASFNIDANDQLVFTVSSKDGYTFDHWVVDDGTWQSKNPLTIKPVGSFSMIAKCLTLDQQEIGT
jgi:hypothetical protein